ncbi:hypothetical protein DKX38_009965 [Salix brachista]|uniref:Uncharacterized protein n=1 Tax=Salix brachista TaxID=2182728 RepID=A0A5N5MBS9_9ROSI|nr:hypothetical protein DKX38_009965 [Salix brachista]
MASNPFWSCLIDTGFDLDEALTLPGNSSQQITDSNSTIVADMPTILTPVDAVCAVCMEEGFRSGLHKNAKVSGIIHEKARDCRVSTKLF